VKWCKKFILKDISIPLDGTLRYGWLLGHYAIRSLMFQASQQANISPLRLGFTGTLKVIRRAIPDFQDLSPEQIPFFSHG
jgi:hypothetical protein